MLAKIALISGSALLLVACTSTSLLEADRAQHALIGMAKSDLFACAGVPNREGTDEKGNLYLAYERADVEHVPAPYPSSGFHPYFGVNRHKGPYFFGGYFGPTTVAENRSCTATFTLNDNKVTALNYITNDGSSGDMRQCYQIVKACLPPAPAKPGS